VSFNRQRFENLASLARAENMLFEIVRAEMGSIVPTRGAGGHVIYCKQKVP